MAKNECNIEPIENNDYPSRLSIDEYPAMPIDKNFWKTDLASASPLSKKFININY